MKKTFLHLLFLGSSISFTCFAQTTDVSKGKSQSTPRELIFTPEKSDTPSGSSSFLLNNININALRDFMESYKNPVDVRWTVLSDGFRVHFYIDDIQVRIFYNKKGNRVALMQYYHEDKLTFRIRDIVKSTYYDFNIDLVTEVTANHKTAYIVKMEDKSSWKTVRIVDGEMEVIEEYLKS